VEFLPGGDFLLSCSRDETIKMWDTNSGFLVQTIKGHTDWVKRVAVNTKGSLMASSSKDETIIIWNMDRIRSSNPQKDAMISVLNEHEHVIDCLKWANPEACKIIDHAEYNRN
jgi:WD40 repeat protein